MTSTEIAKRFNLQPKDVVAYIQENATFPVKRNFQTGELIVPDDININAFLAPLYNQLHAKEIEQERQLAQQQKAAELRLAQQRRAEAERLVKELDHQTRMRLQQEDLEQKQFEGRHSIEIEKLKDTGAAGYYQYKALSLVDEDGGYIDAQRLTENLNALGIEGWHLVVAYANEMGRNSNSSGIGGFSTGTNSTIDQNILIFERFVKFQ